MANIVETQVLQDGHRNFIAKWAGNLDTSDEAYVVKADPATLNTITTQGTTRATELAIEGIQYSIEDGLAVSLWWDVDGTQANAKLICALTGRGKFSERDVGWWPNNATAGGTGKIALSTEGWQMGGVLAYVINIWCKKS